MPANCSADVQAVISRVDKTFLSGNATAIQAMKENFGLGNMTHLDDVAGARMLVSYSICCASLTGSNSSEEQPLGLAKS